MGRARDSHPGDSGRAHPGRATSGDRSGSRVPRPKLARAALAALLAVAATAVGACAPRGPSNLIVVCIDTLRTDRASALGAERPTTPYLAELAGRGTLFTQGQSTSNWTVPAVASLLSGRLPSAHGAIVPGESKNLGVRPEAPSGIRPDVPLLAPLLRERGFETALFSGNPYLYGRFQEGFETTVVAYEDGAAQADRMLAWLADRARRPFFLYWQIMDLHQPLDPPEDRAALFLGDPRPGFPEPPLQNWAFANLAGEGGPEFERYRTEKLALYDGTLRQVDDLLRRLFAELERLGLDRRTLVVVTADHGEEFWDHAAEQASAPADPRGIWGVGHGHTMYQELLRVPVLLIGPGVPAGRRTDCPVSLADVAPTALSRLGAGPLAETDGLDLSPYLRVGDEPCAARPLVSQAPAYGGESSAVRHGRWKLIARAGGEPRLFDLEADPAERRDRAAEHPEVVAELARHARFAEGDVGAGRELPEDAELQRQLRALGYLP